jgi:hypothetical protein
VFAPAGFGDIVRDYFNWERTDGLERIVVFDLALLETAGSLKGMLESYYPSDLLKQQELLNDLDLIDIQSVRVQHCKDSYALIVKHASDGTVA